MCGGLPHSVFIERKGIVQNVSPQKRGDNFPTIEAVAIDLALRRESRAKRWTGFFSGPKYGYGMLAAGMVLAVMVLPYITSVTREVITAVPRQQREAALALGATPWEMLRVAVLRNARIGIFGAIILGLGRALGETMAVTMLIGNRPEIARSLFAPGYTLASVIANEFTEATSDMYLSALVEMALILFALTLVVNAIARLLVWSITRGMPARGLA
jgi:phosphate transport system permease protein